MIFHLICKIYTFGVIIGSELKFYREDPTQLEMEFANFSVLLEVVLQLEIKVSSPGTHVFWNTKRILGLLPIVFMDRVVYTSFKLHLQCYFTILFDLNLHHEIAKNISYHNYQRYFSGMWQKHVILIATVWFLQLRNISHLLLIVYVATNSIIQTNIPKNSVGMNMLCSESS